MRALLVNEQLRGFNFSVLNLSSRSFQSSLTRTSVTATWVRPLYRVPFRKVSFTLFFCILKSWNSEDGPIYCNAIQFDLVIKDHTNIDEFPWNGTKT